MGLLRYLANLSAGRLILWYYFVWYLVVLVRYFDPTPRVWLTSLGLSAIVGLALCISTTAGDPGQMKMKLWPTVRLFMMPFCVSSFAALVKGKGFVLIFSPRLGENVLALGVCALLGVVVAVLKRQRALAANPGSAAPASGIRPH